MTRAYGRAWVTCCLAVTLWVIGATAEATLSLLNEYNAFGPGNAGGEVFVAVGDVDLSNPGEELVAGHGLGGVGWVSIRALDGTLLGAFAVFPTTNNPSGKVHVAVGEFNGSPPMEIACGMGSNAPNGSNGMGWVQVRSNTNEVLANWPAYSTEPGANPSGEVFVAAGDVHSAYPYDEIVTGPGYGGNNWIAVRNPLTGEVLANRPAWGAGNPSGEVPVAVGDFVPGELKEVAVAHGRDGSSWIAVYDGTLTYVIATYPTFGSGNSQGFVNIAAGEMDGLAGDEIVGGHGPEGQNFMGVWQVVPPGLVLIDSGPAYTEVENPSGEVHVAAISQ